MELILSQKRYIIGVHMETHLQKAKHYLSLAQDSFSHRHLPDTVECTEYAFDHAVKHVESTGKSLTPDLLKKVSRRASFQKFICRMGNCWSETIEEDPEEVEFLLHAAEELVQFATAV